MYKKNASLTLGQGSGKYESDLNFFYDFTNDTLYRGSVVVPLEIDEESIRHKATFGAFSEMDTFIGEVNLFQVQRFFCLRKVAYFEAALNFLTDKYSLEVNINEALYDFRHIYVDYGALLKKRSDINKKNLTFFKKLKFFLQKKSAFLRNGPLFIILDILLATILLPSSVQIRKKILLINEGVSSAFKENIKALEDGTYVAFCSSFAQAKFYKKNGINAISPSATDVLFGLIKSSSLSLKIMRVKKKQMIFAGAEQYGCWFNALFPEIWDSFLRRVITTDENVIVTTGDSMPVCRWTRQIRPEWRFVEIQIPPPVVKYGLLPVISDLLCVWGEQSEKWFIENKTDPKKIVRIGSLGTDRLQLSEKVVDPDQHYDVCYITQAEKFDIENLVILTEHCENMGLSLLIRLHPVDQKIRYDFIKKNVRFSQLSPIVDCLNSASIIVGNFSSVLGLAVMMGKPIALLSPDKRDNLELLRFNAAIDLNNTLHLPLLSSATKINALTKKGREKWIEYCYFKLDGNVRQRLQEVLNLDIS